MHEQFFDYISTLLNRTLSEDESLLLRETFQYKKLRKHQFLLQEGEVCKNACFIVTGALKMYSLDDSGKENILGLYLENWWAGDRGSFMNNTPSPYFIDAFETSEVLIVSKERFDHSLSKQPFMGELMRTLAEKQSLQLLKRVHTTKTLTAEQRLTDLEQTYPEFLQRFPQHIIASYLGMTKETLSRIRANAAKK